MQVEELVLRTMVLQFDGRVMEIFGAQNNEVIRHHVAVMKEPQVSTPNRKGRSMVNFGGSGFYIDEDEMRLLRPFLDKITEAIRAAR